MVLRPWTSTFSKEEMRNNVAYPIVILCIAAYSFGMMFIELVKPDYNYEIAGLYLVQTLALIVLFCTELVARMNKSELEFWQENYKDALSKLLQQERLHQKYRAETTEELDKAFEDYQASERKLLQVIAEKNQQLEHFLRSENRQPKRKKNTPLKVVRDESNI